MLHGVLAVVNLGLLMWLIPDELGDEAWVPRRRRGRGRDRRERSPAAAAARARESGALGGPPRHPRGQPSRPRATNLPVSVQPARRALPERSRSQETNEPSADNVENSRQVKHLAARATDAVLSRGGVVLLALAVLAAVIAIVIWMRHH
jgi:hypothetical protein